MHHSVGGVNDDGVELSAPPELGAVAGVPGEHAHLQWFGTGQAQFGLVLLSQHPTVPTDGVGS